ncbi:hypothetical protein Tco_0562727 [Tanacetum coccineum]
MKEYQDSFNRIPDPLCHSGKWSQERTLPIAPTMTMNRLVLEWEERIRLHQEKILEFDQWRSKNFKDKNLILQKLKEELER